jgi:pantoate kinase
MKRAKAFSPGNITCFFAIVGNKNPLKKGSMGVSFAVDRGAYATVYPSKKNNIIVNGKKKRFPTVETALKLINCPTSLIKIRTQLPIGCGYGMSGACTLAALIAVNRLHKLGRNKNEIGLASHKAEVINNTGLGTITAEFLGGALIRSKKGKPLDAIRLKVDRGFVYYKSYGPLDTKKIITSEKMKAKINLFGKQYIRRINPNIRVELDYLIQLSKDFAINTGLLKDKRVIKKISEIEKMGGFASMNMLGKSVFSSIPFKGSKKLHISMKGARLI